MRRLFVPVVIFVIVVTAMVLTGHANDSADPGDPPALTPSDTLGTPILSARRIPEWLRRPTSDTELEAAVRAVLSDSAMPVDRCLRVHRDGSEIAQNNAGVGLAPAELQRLITIAALNEVGSSVGFTTEVIRNTVDVVEDGILDGDLWIIGGSDPVLATGDYTDRFGDNRVFTDLAILAADVVAALGEAGITTIDGRVIGDESRYTPVEPSYEVWPANQDIVGPLSALLVNDGYVWDPETESVTRSRDPAAQAAAELTALIEAAGIEITGLAAAGGELLKAADQLSLASIESPPLAEIAARAVIDGTTAEMLFKEVGVRSGRGAAQAEATAGVFLTLGTAGFPAEFGAVSPIDGSGLADANRATCDLLVAIAESSTESSLVGSALQPITAGPLAGCAPAGSETMELISADTGNVTAIAGRLDATNGDTLTFAFIANGDLAPDADTGDVPAPFAPCNSLETSLLAAISGHPYGPSLDAIAPLPTKTATNTES